MILIASIATWFALILATLGFLAIGKRADREARELFEGESTKGEVMAMTQGVPYCVRSIATGEVFEVWETADHAAAVDGRPVLVRVDNQRSVDQLSVRSLEPTDEEWRDYAVRLGLR